MTQFANLHYGKRTGRFLGAPSPQSGTLVIDGCDRQWFLTGDSKSESPAERKKELRGSTLTFRRGSRQLLVM